MVIADGSAKSEGGEGLSGVMVGEEGPRGRDFPGLGALHFFTQPSTFIDVTSTTIAGLHPIARNGTAVFIY
jgi:hypothetical protein